MTSSKLDTFGGLTFLAATAAVIWWMGHDPHAPDAEDLATVDVGLGQHEQALATTAQQLRCMAAFREGRNPEDCAELAQTTPSTQTQENKK
jgi:hypothetical protein